MLWVQLGVSTAMVVATVMLHLAGLLVLLRIVDRPHDLEKNGSFAGDIARVTGAALGLFALHTLEIWAYAIAYLALGALEHFESALYFSTVTYVAIGYGDVVLDHDWRVTGAIEGANGIILLGWSTAFLVSVVSKLRVLERRWGERPATGETTWISATTVRPAPPEAQPHA